MTKTMKLHYSGSGKPDASNNWLSEEEIDYILKISDPTPKKKP